MRTIDTIQMSNCCESPEISVRNNRIETMIETKYTAREEYLQVIKNTQLISCDLILFNNMSEVLLGKRSNEPAKGKWFVPGGRVLKHENFDDAQKRIADTELNIVLPSNDKKFVGIYHHIYDNNFMNDEFSTHYVCFAYSYRFEKQPQLSIGDGQHDEFKWFSIKELLEDNDVHKYVKNYFCPHAYNDALYN